MADVTDTYDRLRNHVQELQDDPSKTVDAKLLETSQLALPGFIDQEQSQVLILQLSQLLPTLQQDPSEVVKLLLQILQPFSFPEILSSGAAVDFTAGLSLSAQPFNILTLSILEKATNSAHEAAVVAGMQPVFTALVTLWLASPDVGIAEKAASVLVGLLKADSPVPEALKDQDITMTDAGQGAVWKRMFGDRDIYRLLLESTLLKSTNGSIHLSKREKTIAQARLLGLLPQVAALDWSAVEKGHHPELERSAGLSQNEGLLHHAAIHMVDFRSDVLMHMNLIDFFAKLIQTANKNTSTGNSSLPLDFLITHGLHSRSINMYLEPDHPSHDPLDISFLYGSSAQYFSNYASQYPEHFLASSEVERVLSRLNKALDLSSSRWVHSESPKHDLHVLSSIPRVALLPNRPGRLGWSSSPLSLLPSKMTNPDVLHTLATVFHGPESIETITYPAESPLASKTDPYAEVESAAARALYLAYVKYNPQLFKDIVSHAETVALKENALAALSLLSALISANWIALPKEPPTSIVPSGPRLPTEGEFESVLEIPASSAPPSGVLAILSPPSLEHTVPYLMRPAQSFSNLVGGRGDAESAAYKIAAAKFETIKLLHDRLSPFANDQPALEDINAAIARRVSEGPWGRGGEAGSRIATLEL